MRGAREQRASVHGAEETVQGRWCRGDGSVKLRCSKEASEHLTADAGEGAAFV